MTFQKKPIAACIALFCLSAASHAGIPIQAGTYDDIKITNQEWTSTESNTITVKSGSLHYSGCKGSKCGLGIGPDSMIYLQNADAKLHVDGLLQFKGTVKQDANTPLKNFTISGEGEKWFGGNHPLEINAENFTITPTTDAKTVFHNTTVNVTDTMTFNSKEGYLFVGGNSVITADTFTSTGSSRVLKIGDSADRNVPMTGTLAVNHLNVDGMIRNLKDGTLKVAQDGTVGSIFNEGKIEATKANITVKGGEFANSGTYDGKEYIFANGLDKDLTPSERQTATMTVGSLTVKGNALNTEKSSLTVGQQITVDGQFTHEAAANLILTEGAKGQFDAIESHKDGVFKLNKATIAVANASKLGKVDAAGSKVTFGAGSSSIAEFTGDGKQIGFSDLKNNTGVKVDKQVGDVTLVVEGSSLNQYASAEEAAKAAGKNYASDQGKDTVGVEVLDDGVLNGLTGHFDAAGNLIIDSTSVNQPVETIANLAVLPMLTWRHEMNDLTKRMGELRDSPQGVGTWARLYGSEMEYGGQHVKQQNHSIQLGVDTAVTQDWKVGAAFSYTDGDSTYEAGSADNKAYSLAAYGTWFADNGLFVDLIAKYARMESDFTIRDYTGSFKNDAFSVSAETGWHFKLSDVAFVEPQAELSWGRVVGDNFAMGKDITVSQDDTDALIGRLGVRAGFYFPENRGTIYARASMLYDFEGEAATTARAGEASNTIRDDLGGAYYEFGLGANFKLTDSTYTYVDLERTNAGAVKENWRWNVGARIVW